MLPMNCHRGRPAAKNFISSGAKSSCKVQPHVHHLLFSISFSIVEAHKVLEESWNNSFSPCFHRCTLERQA